MESPFAFVIGWVILASCVTSIVMWTRLFHQRLSTKRSWADVLLPASPRERPFWSVFDYLTMFGLTLVLTILLVQVSLALGWIERSEEGQLTSLQTIVAGLIAQSVAGLFSFAAMLLWLRLIRRDALTNLGLVWRPSDLVLGLRFSLLLIPPVLVISSIVAFLIPYEHPVLDSLQASQNVGLFALLFVGTAIVAPLIEEFMYRVLLQGGLQRLADHYEGDLTSDAPLPVEPVADSEPESAWTPRSYWPMVAASFIFAVMHWGQGAAPVPLFFLSLGLGFLYRQTGRITPSLVVHCVLNAFTLSVEFFRLLVESTK